MIPQVDNLPHNLVRNVAKYNIYDRDYRGLASFHLSLSSVHLIYERLGFPLICAKPRFRDRLSFYPAILSRAFRERPGPSLMAELTKFLGEVDRNHLPRRIASVSFEFTRGSVILQPGRNDAYSFWLCTHWVYRGNQSTARSYNRQSQQVSKRWSLLFIKVLFLVKDEGMLAREKVNPGVQIRSLGIHVDDSMVETPYMSI